MILSVPIALLGTAGALVALGVANNLYTRIGLVPLIALGSKNAILIVEVARELRQRGLEIEQVAVEAARRHFRPIVMTSLALILGVVVLSGMLANTCLAVLFVPSFFVLLQRWEKRRRRGTVAAPQPTRG